MPCDVRAYCPAKPLDETRAISVRPQPAPAPSLLVMPFTAIAASSASAARASRASAVGSVGSSKSSARVGIATASCRPTKGSSGTTRAMATARSASAAKPFGSGSVEATIAWRLPMNTRKPRSRLSERSSFSIAPRRRSTESEVEATSNASAASAPAARAALIRSASASSRFMPPNAP